MRNVISAVLLLSCINAMAQDADTAKLKVFMDCRAGCDLTYIRTEIQVVDFVVDQVAADVHVLVTAQGVGSGGQQYQLEFHGQHQYENRLDTLRFTTRPTATADEVRKLLLQQLMLGIAPFVAKTSFASGITLSMKPEASGQAAPEAETRDNWNYWVFRVGLSGEVNADVNYKNNVLNGNFSANRTTDKLKLELYIYGRQHTAHFNQTDDNGHPITYTVKNSDYGVFNDVVKSLSSHWSYGFQLDLSNNTFNNIRRKLYFNPAIEYNIFKYSEVNNRSFILRYGADVNANAYYDTTIYNEIAERLYGHRFSAALTLNKKWGTFFTGINYHSYLHDLKLNSMGISIHTDVRITGGLSFFVHANGSLVHDQISLVRQKVTEQELLTRQRQLASTYNYRTSFGLAYRFGSMLNNFVNPRFEGYAGF